MVFQFWDESPWITRYMIYVIIFIWMNMVNSGNNGYKRAVFLFSGLDQGGEMIG